MTNEVDKLIEHFNQKLKERNIRISYHALYIDGDEPIAVCYGIQKYVIDGFFDLELDLNLKLETEEIEINPSLRQMPSLGGIESILRRKSRVPRSGVDGSILLESFPDNKGTSIREHKVLGVYFIDNKLGEVDFGDANPTAERYREQILSLSSEEDARKAVDLAFKIYDEVNEVEEIGKPI